MPDRDSVRWFVLLTEVAVRAFGPGFRLGISDAKRNWMAVIALRD